MKIHNSSHHLCYSQSYYPQSGSPSIIHNSEVKNLNHLATKCFSLKNKVNEETKKSKCINMRLNSQWQETEIS